MIKRLQPIVVYHGAQRWDPPVVVRPHRGGRAEHGAGIYTTTSYTRARRYARGGGVVIRFELRPGLGWLRDTKLPVETIEAFVRSLPRLRGRQDIIERLHELHARRAPRFGDDAPLPLEYLVNIMVNRRVASGKHGPAVAAFLAKHGADVALANQTSSLDSGTPEDWVVIFNPDVITKWDRVSSDLDVNLYDLPLVRR